MSELNDSIRQFMLESEVPTAAEFARESTWSPMSWFRPEAPPMGRLYLWPTHGEVAHLSYDEDEPLILAA